jgi:hypothetical protein
MMTAVLMLLAEEYGAPDIFGATARFPSAQAISCYDLALPP